MQGTTTEKMIDVVEDFQCPNQSEAYCDAYRKWRRRPDNPYAYTFTKHPKETTFSENPAIVQHSQANAEQMTLRNLGNLIGIALLLYFFIENVLDKLIIWVLNILDVRINFVLLEFSMAGEEAAVFSIMTTIGFLKYLLPALVVLLTLRLPRNVGFPVRLRHPDELLMGLALTMLLSAGLGAFFVFQSTDLNKYQILLDSISSSDYWLFLYEIVTIFLLPIIIALLLHGSLFQVLRQFGDGFAVGTVTVIAMLLMHTPSDILRIGIITLTISYYLLQTGSFLTAVILHIVHEIYMFSLYYLETFEMTYSLQWWIVVLLPCAIGVLAVLHKLIAGTQKTPVMHGTATSLKWPDKAAVLFSAKPLLLMMIFGILMTVVITVITW